ncbi:putative glutamate--cysteine ligase catalytic subunit isoform X2 [Apostichopus japonicus]|uniref:Glutamate--cysteine ligase n=1 Tax=Stichopus japonicus TaxID=307972 RepID=A0A2G8KRY6_STIJA|nr:putative glutamate--cysteine ligase catalytic subunit isoform X2 [Apostichopus japonicus]
MVVPQEGTLLSWEDTQKYADHVRKQGVKQFIRIYHKVKDRSCETFKWGDETEHMLISLDHSERKAFLLLNSMDGIPLVQKSASKDPRFCGEYGSFWVTELPAHLIESTPGKPFELDGTSLTAVEANMKLRRKQINSVLRSHHGRLDACLTLSSFPRNGCKGARIPRKHVNSPTSALQDLIIATEELICPFPRYGAVIRNPEKRRGTEVAINVPVFKDENTDLSQVSEHEAAKPGHVVLEVAVLGIGVAALQVTVQGSDLKEAKYIHDQFVPLSPIMMPVSAAAPIRQGFLTEWDCRWGTLSPAADCRTQEEMGLKPLENQHFRIPKSRMGTANGYLSSVNAKLNDSYFPFDEELYQQFVNEGMDILFARHMARQFIRDPLYILRERLHQNEDESDHFENIAGTNWQCVRFKVPPENSDIGWRAEFRTMDTQLTDFENAAYVVFMVLLSKTIVNLKLDFTMPISRVDENMEIAKLRNAVREGEFYFRKDPYLNKERSDETVICKMNINTIINGGATPEGADFIGLIPLINRYIDSMKDIDKEQRSTLNDYLKLISDRAAGRVKTTAQWIRDFVDQHPGYKHDSVISEDITYDLIKLCSDISNGTKEALHIKCST